MLTSSNVTVKKTPNLIIDVDSSDLHIYFFIFKSATLTVITSKGTTIGAVRSPSENSSSVLVLSVNTNSSGFTPVRVHPSVSPNLLSVYESKLTGNSLASTSSSPTLSPATEGVSSDDCGLPTSGEQVQVALMLVIDLLQAASGEMFDAPVTLTNTRSLSSKRTDGDSTEPTTEVNGFQDNLTQEISNRGEIIERHSARDILQAGPVRGERKETLSSSGPSQEDHSALQQLVCCTSHLAASSGILTDLVFHELR